MEKESYHTHSAVSDGKLSPRELIECAISKGFKTLAITDHYPRPPGIVSSTWSKGFYTDENYAEMKSLQKEYVDRIKVLVGVEFEWFSGKEDWLFGEVNRRDYDVKIVAIHQIFAEGKYYTINYSDEIFEEVLSVLGGDIKRVVAIYYETLRKAVRSGWFDIVGHFDLIKARNADSKYFSGDEDWYKEEVIKTLDVIKEVGIKMEVNLQGLIRPCKEQWPSKWIIDEAKSRGIEFVVGTDAHDESGLDYDIDEVEKILN
jgi:histidinol-phosphatase (PHP family)